jgi:hypothetical protein
MLSAPSNGSKIEKQLREWKTPAVEVLAFRDTRGVVGSDLDGNIPDKS